MAVTCRLACNDRGLVTTGRARRRDVPERFTGFQKLQKTIQYRGVAQLGRALRSGRRSRKFESCHLDQKAKGTARPFLLLFRLMRQFALVVALQQRKFAYLARRSTSSLVRRRAWVSRSVAKLPCHLDQNRL